MGMSLRFLGGDKKEEEGKMEGSKIKENSDCLEEGGLVEGGDVDKEEKNGDNEK